MNEYIIFKTAYEIAKRDWITPAQAMKLPFDEIWNTWVTI